MSVTYQCADQDSLAAAVDHAARVVADGECIVLPTDTVYGIGCDAFSPVGVQTLLGAKGRTREMPPPVLIADAGVMAGLADQPSQDAEALAREFWPGALTLVCWAQPTLGWDLGETHGTVALRVPADDVARRVLTRVGPMAVSSANLTGAPAAQTAGQAEGMLQDRVALYLDDGPRPAVARIGVTGDAVVSTIVDCTGETPVVLRHGAISLAELRRVVPGMDGGADTVGGGAGGAHAADGHPHDVPGSHGSTSAAEFLSVPEAAVEGPFRAGSGRHRRETTPAPSDMPGPAASDNDVARTLVHSAPAVSDGRLVDQNRKRGDAAQPRRSGTSALGSDEAARLVNGS